MVIVRNVLVFFVAVFWFNTTLKSQVVTGLLNNLNGVLNCDSDKNFDSEIVSWNYSLQDSALSGPFYDRWGNPIPLNAVYRNEGGNNANIGKYEVRKGIKSSEEISAGHFVLHFLEKDKNGFMHPEKGDERKEVFVAVCEYLSSLIETPPVNTCTNEPGKAHVMVNFSKVQDPDVLASATPTVVTPDIDEIILDGEMWKVLNTGSSSKSTIYHGYINVNFSHNTFNLGYDNEMFFEGYDLYTVLLHEMIHLMGFNSFLDKDGNSVFDRVHPLTQQPGKVFFSRYDLLLSRNQKLAIESTGSNLFYNLHSTFNSDDVAAGCDQVSLKRFTNCGSFTNTPEVYSSQQFVAGMNLSHLDHSCGSLILEKPYVMRPELANSTAVRILSEIEKEILDELGYAINTLNSDNVRGGVDEGLDCNNIIKQEFIYDCTTEDPLSLSIISGNENNPSSIEGLRIILGEGEISLSPDNQLLYTKNTEYTGPVKIQYVPTYGCQFGNITEVILYVRDCSPSICIEPESDPRCEENCNSDINYNTLNSEPVDGCRLKALEITQGVPNWHPAGMRQGEASYVQFSRENFGLFQGQLEPVYHDVNLKQGETYLITLDALIALTYPPGEEFDACFFGEIDLENEGYEVNVRLRALNNYLPFSDDAIPPASVNRSWNGAFFYEDFELYLEQNGFETEVIKDIDGKDLANEFRTFNFCFTADQNFNAVSLFFDLDTEAEGEFPLNHKKLALYTDNLIIKKINKEPVNDALVPTCGGEVNLVFNDICGLDAEALEFDWFDADNNVIGSGPITTKTLIPGTYNLKGSVDNTGEVCFESNFRVFSDSEIPDFELRNGLSDFQSVGHVINVTEDGDKLVSGVFTDFLSIGDQNQITTNLSSGINNYLAKYNSCNFLEWLLVLPDGIEPTQGSSQNDISVSNNRVYWSANVNTYFIAPYRVYYTNEIYQDYNIIADPQLNAENSIIAEVDLETGEIIDYDVMEGYCSGIGSNENEILCFSIIPLGTEGAKRRNVLSYIPSLISSGPSVVYPILSEGLPYKDIDIEVNYGQAVFSLLHAWSEGSPNDYRHFSVLSADATNLNSLNWGNTFFVSPNVNGDRTILSPKTKLLSSGDVAVAFGFEGSLSKDGYQFSTNGTPKYILSVMDGESGQILHMEELISPTVGKSISSLGNIWSGQNEFYVVGSSGDIVNNNYFNEKHYFASYENSGQFNFSVELTIPGRMEYLCLLEEGKGLFTGVYTEDFSLNGRTLNTNVPNMISGTIDLTNGIASLSGGSPGEPNFSNLTNIELLEINSRTDNFKVFPNPTFDLINFSFAYKNGFQVELSDPSGRILKLKEVNSITDTYMYLNDIPNGVYFLHIKSAENAERDIVRRVVKL